MKTKLAEAIELRKNNKPEEATQILAALLQSDPNDPEVNYQMAWTCDFIRHATAPDGVPIFKCGPIEVDRAAHLVRVNGEEVKLTATEYSLLGVLVAHAGKVVPHRHVLNEVWGPNSVEHNHYLRVYFGQIRKKFDAAMPGTGDLIVTESGVGYRLRTN